MAVLTTAPETAQLPLVQREPAVLLGGAQAVLAAVLSLAAYWVDGLTPGLQAAILAVSAAVIAIVGAWRVAAAGGQTINPALFYGLFQALVPLAVLLGLDLPPGADAAILAVVSAGLSLATRNEASPRAALRSAG